MCLGVQVGGYPGCVNDALRPWNDLSIRLWMKRAMFCLQGKRGILLSASNPPDPSVSSTAIW